ncbi:MAG: LLM class flavin-dependent oxidoreductase [Acetobacteraceae bacterium]|nr:LLM class flavin-dependent oxidoreductase [Acetobacteraceae bacterium]
MTCEGRFHSFRNVTSLPRPTQRPRPPFYVAALGTKDSFERAGAAGHAVMAIPMAGGAMAELIGAYREAWKRADHPGSGTVMLAFHMFCHHDQAEAERIARGPLGRYLRSLVDAASDWTSGASSADYPSYDKIIAGLAAERFETQVAKCAAWVGTPPSS